MDLSHFLKPNWKKIGISILLSAIAGLFTFHRILSLFVFPFYFATKLFYNIPIYLTIPLFFLISYPFGCYIAENKKWLKGIFLYLVVFIFVSIIILLLIGEYNKIFGHFCNNDFDCKFICGTGAVNKKFIYLRYPWEIIDCFTTSALCINNKCRGIELRKENPELSIVLCERIKNKDQNEGDYCYFILAVREKDITLCEKISVNSLKQLCIGSLTE